MLKPNKNGIKLRPKTASVTDQNVFLQDPKKVDRQLDDFEKGIVLLKRDYEIFFAGAAKQPPTDLRNKLQASAKELQTLQGISYAQRFRYNSLQARLSSYLDLWSKQMRMKEEGKLGVHPAPHQVVKTKTVARETGAYENVFKDYIKSRESTGERSPSLNYDGFSDLLKKQKETLMQKFQCKDIQFYVTIENGRTKLKARTVK